MYAKADKINIIRKYHKKLEAFGSKNKYHKEIIAHMLVCIVIANNNRGKKLFQIKDFVDAYYELTALLNKNYKIIYDSIKFPAYETKEYLKLLRKLIGKLGSLPCVSTGIMSHKIFEYLETPEKFRLSETCREYRNILNKKHPDYFLPQNQSTVDFSQKPLLIKTQKICGLSAEFEKKNCRAIFQNGNFIILSNHKNILQCIVYNIEKSKIISMHRRSHKFNIVSLQSLFFNNKYLLFSCHTEPGSYAGKFILCDLCKPTIQEIKALTHEGICPEILGLTREGNIFYFYPSRPGKLRVIRTEESMESKVILPNDIASGEDCYHSCGTYNKLKQQIIFYRASRSTPCENHTYPKVKKIVIYDCNENKKIEEWTPNTKENICQIEYVPVNKMISIQQFGNRSFTYALWDLEKKLKLKTTSIIRLQHCRYYCELIGSHIITTSDPLKRSMALANCYDFDLNPIEIKHLCKLNQSCYAYTILPYGYVIRVVRENNSIRINTYKFPRKGNSV